MCHIPVISPLIQNPITNHEENTRKKEMNTYLILERGGTLEAKKKRGNCKEKYLRKILTCLGIKNIKNIKSRKSIFSQI